MSNILDYNHQIMLATQKLPNTYEQSIGNKQFNTSALTVWAEQNYFYLEPNYAKCLIPTVLKIDRRKQSVQQIKSQLFQVPKTAVPFYFSFFIGIINFGGKKLLMLSETVQVVCSINQRDIFKITKPLFLFYRPEDKKQLSEQQAKILINLVIIYEQGMYFSYAYNLTQPLHHIKKLDNDQISCKFNWAQTFQQQLSNFSNMWSLPVIQGFVNKIQLYINAQKLKIILISRRSIKQGGPWQYTTGLGEGGSVANFVQTQQIFLINQYLFSFIQIRGSVPLYWNQKFSYGMPSNIEINKQPDQNYQGFRKHLGRVLNNRQYDFVVLLNLLNKQSSSQKKLIQNYQYLVRNTDKQKNINLDFPGSLSSKSSIGLRYYYFDIHSKCQNKEYSSLNDFISLELESILYCCGFTALHVKPDKNYQIINLQKGIIRSNCATCIDRTNIAQSRIAAFQLVFILGQLNININNFDKKLSFIDSNDAFAILYRNLWADNGDNISKQYTGTGSTESYAIRKGKLSYLTTIDHGMTSLVRAFRNIRQEDEQKNKTVLFLLKGIKQRKNSILFSNNTAKPQKMQQNKQVIHLKQVKQNVEIHNQIREQKSEQSLTKNSQDSEKIKKQEKQQKDLI